jgi:hypothetical protein
MIDKRAVLLAAAAACLATGACSKKAAEGNKATGEVLEGTISDAMVAPDRVHSEPPLAPRPTGAGGDKPGKAKAGRDEARQQGETPEPDVTPTPETAPTPKPAASEPTD